MYRLIAITLLCLKAASSAPQAKESDVTYVKIQPVVKDTPAEAATNIRESRIEKLPLTIPGNTTNNGGKEPDKTSENKENESNLSENKSESSKSDEFKANSAPENEEPSKEKSDKLSEKQTGNNDNLTELVEPEATEINENQSSFDQPEVSPSDDLTESDSETLSDTIPSETNQQDRRARTFESVETTETTEDGTEKYEDELIDHTEIEAPRTRTPPKFVPKVPKLSYFQKPRVYQSYSSNLVENSGKRRFRSRCRCEKIWNCPKLQISVPRCPDEYFLCCF